MYLTNTLEEGHEIGKLPLFTQWLAEEANAASRIKQEAPVMVVLGNPPYSGHSANTGAWIANLLRGMDTQTGKPTSNYFEVDGEPLGERQPKWLNDDYVKFIRFAQWRIEQTGYGVLAFISNHGYLDNPTFRGMRQSLMETFDDIYVLDLHGNSKKKERAPDGSKDENVFDIQQGVAIGIFVKRAGAKKEVATVRHAHLWGVRETYEQDAHGERVLTGGKYHWLWRNELNTTAWTILEPQSPFYLFKSQDVIVRTEYEKNYSLPQILPTNNVGFVSARDGFVIDFEESALRNRLKAFRANESEISDDELKEKYGLKDTSSWNIKKARKKVRANSDWENDFSKCLYRPFDLRNIYYSIDVLERPVRQIQRHMLSGDNLGLSTTRSIEIGRGWEHVFCTRHIIQHHTVSLKEVNYLFPLYLYPERDKKNFFDANEPTDAPGGRRPNLAPEFVTEVERRLGLSFVADGRGDLIETFGPEDLFAYMYAVFHSPAYRSRYSEFLKIDFPRLPLTSQPELFRLLSAHGSRLVRLHLLEERAPDLVSFPVGGTNAVEAVRYTTAGEAGADEGRVWINREQYFAGVPPEVWNFHVGGYQVASKWLKDRKGRTLTYDDLAHYRQTLAALAETIRLMSEIDACIEAHGDWPLR